MVMNDQIEEMQELGISAIALLMDSELLESVCETTGAISNLFLAP